MTKVSISREQRVALLRRLRQIAATGEYAQLSTLKSARNR